MARILVVDDSAQNLSLIELYLRGTEFEVVTASGGHAALDLCMQQSFTLILLDVVMPGIDGFEVCRRQRRKHVLLAHHCALGGEDLLVGPVGNGRAWGGKSVGIPCRQFGGRLAGWAGR